MTDPAKREVFTTLRRMDKASMLHYSSQTDMVYFFGGWLSSFAPFPFHGTAYPLESDSDGVATMFYETREHWFQAHKTLDDTRFLKIATSGSPGESKELGNDRRRTTLRPGWDDGLAYRVMLTGIELQLATHANLRQKLMDTGDRPIAEDSPWDYIWGIRDAKGGFTGKNLLGKAWMEARETLSY